MASIELSRVGKTYPGGIEAVQDLSLQVLDHELFVFLGPSGSGKTTTLRLIAGLETATQGAIRIDGQEVTRWPPHRRQLAMLFQTPALYPHLTVRQNLAFGQRGPYNLTSWWSRRPAAARLRGEVDTTARLLGIEPLLDRKPAELSGGERQRVALGRAMLRHPAVFLLDEPLAHVDPGLRSQLRQELKALQRAQRATLIWVTHDHAEALALADRIGVMQAGRLLQVGMPADVYERPATSAIAALVGQPAMNLLPGEIVGNESGPRIRLGAAELPLPSGWRPWAGRYSGQAVILGVRPQDVQLGPGSFAMPMKVRLVEYGEGMVFVVLDGQKLALTSLVKAGLEVQIGEHVNVTWAWRMTHLFDRATGVRIEAPPD